MKRIYTPRIHKHILIVDDDETVSSVYQSKLQSERFKVDIASNGERALTMLATLPIDLMILDLSLPGMDGLEVLKTIRSQSEAAPLPVIVFSNDYVPGLMKGASEAGATECVRKSECTPRRMVEIVREVLAIDGTSRQVASNAEPASAPAADLSVNDGGHTPSENFEIAYQAKLVADFLANAPQKLSRLRAGYHTFISARQEDLRPAEFFEMHHQARLLAGAAGVSGFRKIAQLAAALEALLIQLFGKPACITPSVTRTIAQAVDLLASLCEHASEPEKAATVPPAILVVDDEIISRETICSAIAKANLSAQSVEDPIVAEGLMERTHFDLIFLDVEMPGKNGLDLCASVRKMTVNGATPVVFVTAHSDFESRAQSSLRGGSDFIAKPFLSVELAVKTLTWLFKERLKPALKMEAAPVPENVNDLQISRPGPVKPNIQTLPLTTPHSLAV